MHRTSILLRVRSRARQLLTPVAAGAAALVVFTLPSALASRDSGGAAAPAGASAPRLPRCFGAASRDVVDRCRNRSLRYKVIPTPDQALLAPNAPCEPVYNSVPYICEFGAPLEDASGTIALIGDSHATHWRGALIGVAAAYNWHGASMTRSGCTFSKAEPRLPGKLKGECIQWRSDVYQWLSRPPGGADGLHLPAPGPHRGAARPQRARDEAAGLPQRLPGAARHASATSC